MNSLGARGESIAADYLEDHGWEVVAKNVTYNFGEIDLVAQRIVRRGRGYAKRIAFVEVKTRYLNKRCRPERNITKTKRRKLVRLGQCYLKDRNIEDALVQFDVIAIEVGKETTVRHYGAAFDAMGNI